MSQYFEKQSKTHQQNHSFLNFKINIRVKNSLSIRGKTFYGNTIDYRNFMQNTQHLPRIFKVNYEFNKNDAETLSIPTQKTNWS